MNPILFKQKIDSFLIAKKYNDINYWLGFDQQFIFEQLEPSLFDKTLKMFYSTLDCDISNKERTLILETVKDKINELILSLSELNFLKKPELTNDFVNTWQPYYDFKKYLEYEISSLNESKYKPSNEDKIQKSEFAEFQPKGIINNTQLEIFLRLFPKGSTGIYKYCAKSYYYDFKENFDLLKSEIVENLIVYTGSHQIGYLKKIKYELKRAKELYSSNEHIAFIEKEYVKLLKGLNIEVKPINELCEDHNQYYDTEFCELINFEYDHMDIRSMENERREKGLDGQWYPIFDRFFRIICDMVMQYFIIELDTFINDLEIENNHLPISNQKEQTEKSINEKHQNQQLHGGNNGIENKYLEIYFKKFFDIEIDFDEENQIITFNGEKFNYENETVVSELVVYKGEILSEAGETIVRMKSDPLYFRVKKHLVNITNLFLNEINKNILITKDKETKNEYLLSIQRKNKWHQSNVKNLISKMESDGLHTFSNTNFCKITSAGKLLKRGELDSEFQTLNELIKITYDTAETFNEELNNFITPDQNTNVFTKKENLIKWNSSPSHFGFIISELINKGYFENLPIHNGEVNYSEIARLFSSIVDFNTSEQNLLKSFNPNNEKISETVKKKFEIPKCEDIKPKNSPNKVAVKKTTKPPIKPK